MEQPLLDSKEPKSSAHSQSRRDPNESMYIDPTAQEADLTLAQNYAKAKKIYDITNSNFSSTVCPYSGLPYEGVKELGIMCSTKCLYYLGSGYALYFRFYKYCMYIMLFTLLVAGIYNMSNSLEYRDCADDTDKYCAVDFTNSMTIANQRKHLDTLRNNQYINIVVVSLLLLFFQYTRYQIRFTNNQARSMSLTPSDYTLEFRGMSTKPGDKLYSDESIKWWLENLPLQNQNIPIRVAAITRGYDIAEYMYYIKEKERLFHIQKKGNYEDLEHLNFMIDSVNFKIEELKGQNYSYSDVLYVSFDTPRMAERVYKHFRKTICRRTYLRFKKVVRHAFAEEKFIFRQKEIEVKRAPEPTDICWENLAYNSFQKFRKRAKSNLIQLFFILVGFCIITLVTWGQLHSFEINGEHSFISTVWTLGASASMSTFDPVLIVAVILMTKKEKHTTKTQYLAVTSTRIAMFKTFNTGATFFLAKLGILFFSDDMSFYNLNMFGSGGFFTNMFLYLFMTSFAQPCFAILDPIWLIKVYKQRKIKKNPELLKEMSQQELNEIFEGPESDIEIRYGFLISTMLMSFFYAPAMPFCLVFNLGWLFINYWCDKYVILKRIALPAMLGDQLQSSMQEKFEHIALYFGVGNFLSLLALQDPNRNFVFFQFDQGTQYLIVITALLGLLPFVLPFDYLNELLFKISDFKEKNVPWETARLHFFTNYDIENPITRYYAVDKLLTEIKERTEEVAEIKKKIKDEFSPLIAVRTQMLEKEKADIEENGQPIERRQTNAYLGMNDYAEDQGDKKRQGILNKMQNVFRFSQIKNFAGDLVTAPVKMVKRGADKIFSKKSVDVREEEQLEKILEISESREQGGDTSEERKNEESSQD